MATATPVKLCPRCEEALPDPRPLKCPHCQTSLSAEKKPASRFFECPDYLAFQKDDAIKLGDLKPGQESPAEALKRIAEARDDLTNFVREAEPEVLAAALFDAHLILSHALHSRIDGARLKRIVASARAIGKLAETIDQYIKAGGSLYDDGKTGEAGQVFSASESPGGGATATAGGRVPT